MASSPSLKDNRAYLFLARGVQETSSPNPDEHELVEVSPGARERASRPRPLGKDSQFRWGCGHHARPGAAAGVGKKKPGTMCSGLPVSLCACGLAGERAAAAAAALDVGVVDSETGAHEAVYVVELRARDVGDAHRVDDTLTPLVSKTSSSSAISSSK